MDLDYLDADVAYLLGLLVARGERMTVGGTHRLTVHFPKGLLIAEGLHESFSTDREIQLGIATIRERILELLDCDIRAVDAGSSWDMIATMNRRTVAWRDIAMILEDRSSYTDFQVPAVIMDASTPSDFKLEFIRGYADVAGNIRPANRDQSGRHRVRLDTLNYRGNWRVPVQLCHVLQDGLGVPVQLITWGHPNLGREWREHQLNIYADEFEKVGFFFPFKQTALKELADANRRMGGTAQSACPGRRRLAHSRRKPADPEEGNVSRLDAALVGKHCDAYWQICKELGCTREPPPGVQIPMPLEE